MTIFGNFGWKDIAFLPWGATHLAAAGIEKGANWVKGQAEGELGGGGSAGPAPTLDPNAYQYGGAPGAADQAANLATATGQQAGGIGAQAFLAGNDTAKEGSNMLGYGRSLLAQRNADAQRFDARQTAQPYASQLAGLESTEGPSAAQAQLQNGTNMGMAQQLALARSGRGMGGNAAALGLAQGNMAGIAANQANQAAGLRAQENAAWRQRQASNLGMANSQILQGQAQNDAMYGGMQTLGMGALGQGQDAYLAARAQQNQNWGTTLGGIQTNLQSQQVANQIRDQQLQGSMGAQDDMIRIWAAKNGFDLQEKQRKDAQDAAILSAASSGAASYFGSGGGR
jgi:hypothetical protein